MRNISALRDRGHVLAVDLPGLGDAAALPKGYSAADAVDVFVRGVREVAPRDGLHVMAFSWGCAISAQAARHLEDRLESLFLVGPSSLGDIPRRLGMQPLIRRTPDMSIDEVHAANRENLARLMIHDRSKIDDLAVYLQTTNTQRARFNSPQFAHSRLVLDGVARTRVPLKVVYGEFDAPALPDVAGKESLFRAERNDVEFAMIPDVGHWLPYEQPDTFNRLALDWVTKNAAIERQ